MNLQIQWTPIALQSLSEVLTYTYGQFGERQLRKLSRRLHVVEQNITFFPYLGKKETVLVKATGIEYRSIAVIKEIKLLYTINDSILTIEYVKNNKMDDSTILNIINNSKSQ